MAYRENPEVKLEEAVREAQGERDILLITDPYERAAALADLVREQYPFAWKLKSIQDAAAQAVGVPTNAELERMAEEHQDDWDEPDDRTVKAEMNRIGLYLIGASGLFVMGEMYPGAIGLSLLGTTLIALSKSLDNEEDTD